MVKGCHNFDAGINAPIKIVNFIFIHKRNFEIKPEYSYYQTYTVNF